MIILDRNIPREVRKRLLLRRTRIFTRWLKITFEKPYTLFLAAFFPFMQAFLASIIVIYTNPDTNDLFTNMMFIFSCRVILFSLCDEFKKSNSRKLAWSFTLGVFWSSWDIMRKTFTDFIDSLSIFLPYHII